MSVSTLPLLVLVLSLFSCTQEKPVSLFMANHQDSWITDGPGDWTFKDDEMIMISDSGSSFIMTRKMYQNFELQVEFFPDSTVNSGVFIHCQNRELSAATCYEFNIWDLHPNQDFRTGAVVTRAKPLKIVETLNQWNTYRIRVENGKLAAWINEIKTVDLENAELNEGYIALQAAGQGTVKFRNAHLRELQP